MSKRLKTLPKHVRAVRTPVQRIGAAAIAVSFKGRTALSWLFGGVPMHVNLPISAGGNAVEAARTAIRDLRRQHGFAVPA